MYHADNPHDSADRNRQGEPRQNPQADGEIVIERKPIIADGARDDERPSGGTERRRTERRRIDRMSTGI
jgi:hypothetical protein